MIREIGSPGLIAIALIMTGCAAELPNTTTNTAQDGDEPVICDREPQTGSRVGRRTCMTRAEREELAAETRENLERWQRDASLGGPEGN